MQSTNACQVFVLTEDSERSLTENSIRSVKSQAAIAHLRAYNLLEDIAQHAEAQPTASCLIISRRCFNDETTRVVREVKNRFPHIPTIVLGDIEPSSISGSADSISESQQKLPSAVLEAVAWSERYLRLKEQSAKIGLLNQRELSIVNMASDGLPNKAVAAKLGISIKTVEKYRRNAYQKLNVTSTASMVTLIAFRRYAMPDSVVAGIEL